MTLSLKILMITSEHNSEDCFCVGFPHTLSGAAIFLSLFIYLFVYESQV